MDSMKIETRLMKMAIQKILNKYIRESTGMGNVSIHLEDILVQFDGEEGHAWLNGRVDFKGTDIFKLFKLGD